MIGKTHIVGGITLASVGLCICAVSTTNYGDGLFAYKNLFPVGVLIGSALGSLLPDIDHEGSTISKKLKVVSKIASKTTEHRGITHTLLGWFIYSLIVIGIAGLLYNNFNTPTKIVTSLFCIFSLYLGINYILKGINKIHRVKKMTEKRYIAITVFTIITFILAFTRARILFYFLLGEAFGSSIGYLSHLFLDMFTFSKVAILYPITKKRFGIGIVRTNSDGENIFRNVLWLIEVIAIVVYFIILFKF